MWYTAIEDELALMHNLHSLAVYSTAYSPVCGSAITSVMEPIRITSCSELRHMVLTRLVNNEIKCLRRVSVCMLNCLACFQHRAKWIRVSGTREESHFGSL